MEIHLIAKNELEAQGIQWMVTSHLTGVQLIPLCSKASARSDYFGYGRLER
ncbi:hypothetical protein J22TS1_50180 [Siminovitchia terrae]|uniref:hypothetical protein n=1 Tax=Siminovitchia terrae TaxID=1914933 RepID=UPI001B20837E|nr:hypothetical protein [Siminovitchia terrae]GIN93967.1 hypothetical protein J22TS1_50180 [Siminovitchia terrae]